MDGDLISRKELRDIWLYNGLNEHIYCTNDVLDSIDEQPAADAEPVRHGRWIHTTKEDSDWGGTFHIYTCSACNWSMGDNPTSWSLFCPHCGAKMEFKER